MSSTIDVPFTDLYLCLMNIEIHLQQTDLEFFGELHKASYSAKEKPGPEKGVKNESIFLQDRLC